VLRVVGLSLIVIALMMFMVFAVAHYHEFKSTSYLHRSADTRVLFAGTKAVVVSSTSISAPVRVEGYQYAVKAELFPGDITSIQGPFQVTACNVTAKAYLVEEKAFNTKLKGVIISMEHSEEDVARLKNLLERHASGEAVFTKVTYFMYESDDLPLGRGDYVLVVLVEYFFNETVTLPNGTIVANRVVLPNGTLIVVNSTAIMQPGVRATLSPLLMPHVEVLLIGSLKPTLGQVLRALDVLVLGAVLIAIDYVRSRRHLSWGFRIKS